VNALGQAIDNTGSFGIKNYVEGALYLGILPLVLALYALVHVTLGITNRREHHRKYHLNWEFPHILIFSVLALLGLSFMFGLPTYALLYKLPGISQLHSPFRWISP